VTHQNDNGRTSSKLAGHGSAQPAELETADPAAGLPGLDWLETMLEAMATDLREASSNPSRALQAMFGASQRCEQLLDHLRRERADASAATSARRLLGPEPGKIQQAMSLCKAHILHHGPASARVLLRAAKSVNFGRAAPGRLSDLLSKDPDLFYEPKTGWRSRFADALEAGVQSADHPGRSTAEGRRAAVQLIDGWFAGAHIGPRGKGLANLIAFSRPPNPKRTAVVAEVRQLLKAHNRPMRRGELFKALVARGVVIGGRDPRMVLGMMLTRSPDEIVRLNGAGYWLADAELADVVRDR
jgi:hypothetical protein